MYPRTKYEMSKEDLKELLNSMKPVHAIMLQCGTPPSRQENANSAWKKLGNKMGFDYMTVRPSGEGDRFFTAVPSETEQHKNARIKKEVEKEKQAKLIKIQLKINELENQKQELLADK